MQNDSDKITVQILLFHLIFMITAFICIDYFVNMIYQLTCSTKKLSVH